MNLQKEKQRIIAALNERDEEWLILAFKKLLDIDAPQSFSNDHKLILEERMEEYRKKPSDVLLPAQVKESFRNEGRI